MNVLLKSAYIVDKTSPFHKLTMDILIEDGIITEIAEIIKPNKSVREINLENLHVSQGWFDSSVCFGEPGFEERETIENGLLTAAKSGFTSVVLNPNIDPVADSKSTIEYLINKAKGFATKLYPIGNLTKKGESKDIAELYDMQNSGAIAFGDYNKPISNGNLLKIALQYTQNFNGLVLSFPNDNSVSGGGLVNEGVNSTKLGLKGIPALAEELQVSRDLFLLEYTHGKLHIPTITTATSVKLIKEAKRKGLNVSCSVAAHHLVLNDNEIEGFNANTKVLPPLRTKKDCQALIKGLKDGTIDMITSDHNPIDIEHKKVEYQNAKFGTIGLESLFGALNKKLDLELLIEKLTTKPKQIFGLESYTINLGKVADFTLFNPTTESVFSKENILSTSKNSIFLNKKLNGKVYGIYSNKKLNL